MKGKCITDLLYEDVNRTFERALMFMHKMPRIWIDYCKLMTKQGFITRTRLIFDRAFRALPITQHYRIWPLYIDFFINSEVQETAVRVYRRYLKVNILYCALIDFNELKILVLYFFFSLHLKKQKII